MRSSETYEGRFNPTLAKWLNAGWNPGKALSEILQVGVFSVHDHPGFQRTVSCGLDRVNHQLFGFGRALEMHDVTAGF